MRCIICKFHKPQRSLFEALGQTGLPVLVSGRDRFVVEIEERPIYVEDGLFERFDTLVQAIYGCFFSLPIGSLRQPDLGPPTLS